MQHLTISTSASNSPAKSLQTYLKSDARFRAISSERGNSYVTNTETFASNVHAGNPSGSDRVDYLGDISTPNDYENFGPAALPTPCIV